MIITRHRVLKKKDKISSRDMHIIDNIRIYVFIYKRIKVEENTVTCVQVR